MSLNNKGSPMKLRRLAALLATTLICSAAAAAPITWTPVTGGNMPAPQSGSSITFMPLGQTSYGSDGSTATTVGPTTIRSNGTSSYNSGDLSTHSDGTITQRIGDTVYGQRPDGSQFYCTKPADQVICRPR